MGNIWTLTKMRMRLAVRNRAFFFFSFVMPLIFLFGAITFFGKGGSGNAVSYDGSWSGTMCLTESHCGTDLGLLRTKAVPRPDGSYRLSGSKIFISAGEHDLTENIIHLVLARLPDAPPGTRGQPSRQPPGPGAQAGAPGDRNGRT